MVWEITRLAPCQIEIIKEALERLDPLTLPGADSGTPYDHEEALRAVTLDLKMLKLERRA